MSYRITYGRVQRHFRLWPILLVAVIGGVIWLKTGGYDDLARYVGGMILGAQ